MSTATWTIDKDAAELIAREEEPKRWNLDRAWVSNWALASANQYDWAAFDDDENPSEIICWRCAIKQVIDGEREKAGLFTYEEQEEVLCSVCNEIWVGGTTVECECCGEYTWSTPVVHPETYLWGNHTPYQEHGGAVKLYPDGQENYDDREDEEGRWVCYDCIDKHYNWSAETFAYTRKGN